MNRLCLFGKSSRYCVSIRHSLVFLSLMLGAARCLNAGTPAASLTLQISNETAPAGGWVQLKVSLSAPALVGSGRSGSAWRDHYDSWSRPWAAAGFV
jgi:hypothetical protein